VWKGKKMAGQMGAKQRTTQHLQVVRIDAERGLVMIKGAVPGSEGGYLYIRDSVRRPMPEGAPMPAAVKQDAAPAPESDDAAATDQSAEPAADNTENGEA